MWGLDISAGRCCALWRQRAVRRLQVRERNCLHAGPAPGDKGRRRPAPPHAGEGLVGRQARERAVLNHSAFETSRRLKGVFSALTPRCGVSHVCGGRADKYFHENPLTGENP